MSKILDTFGGILMCLAEILIGVLLLINPISFTSGIIMGLGWLLLVMGVMSIVSYFRTPAAEAARQQSLVKGLGLVLIGVFCALNSEWFIATFPLLTMVYGAGILALGLVRVQWTVDALRMKNGKWYWPAIGAVLSLILAAIILRNPFATATVMWTFIAVSLIAEAVVDMVTLIFTGERASRQ